MNLEKDLLYESFVNPPAEARPFVRWWWGGNCVAEEELIRQLDSLQRAGVGGVEINPIGAPPKNSPQPQEPLQWLSDEWNSVVRKVKEDAGQRGTTVDLIAGTGWPYGGGEIEPDEQIQIVYPAKKVIEGPTVYVANMLSTAKRVIFYAPYFAIA